MASTLNRRFQDWCLSVCGLGVVVAGVSALDQTCRRYIFDALHGEVPALLPGLRIHAVAAQIAGMLPMGTASFLAFGAVALVLVVVMVRS